MSNSDDPRIGLGVGLMTAYLTGDEDGFYAITNEFEEPEEALAALGRVTEAVIGMFAQALGRDRVELWREIATVIAAS